MLTIVWTDPVTDKIQRANLDGSNIEDLVTRTQGLEYPRGIASHKVRCREWQDVLDRFWHG